METYSVVLRLAIVVQVSVVSPEVAVFLLSDSPTLKLFRVTIFSVAPVKWSIESEEIPDETQYMMRAFRITYEGIVVGFSIDCGIGERLTSNVQAVMHTQTT